MLNMSLARPLVIDTNKLEWVASPAMQVERKPLEREAAESGHTTSVVRYLAGASFKPHRHPLGEEILVLEGVFQDNSGDYPAGTYIRNPPGSEHRPASENGCLILVKLNQFAPDDSEQVVVTDLFAQTVGEYLLHQYQQERTIWITSSKTCSLITHWDMQDSELLIVSGQLIGESESYEAGCWLRNFQFEGDWQMQAGTQMLVKTGQHARLLAAAEESE